MNMVCIFIIIGLCCYLHDSIFTFGIKEQMDT